MRKTLLSVFLLLILLPVLRAFASAPAGSTGYLITNDDVAGRATRDSATFFPIASDGSLSTPTKVTVGGAGSGGGFFAANRIAVQSSFTSPCAFFSQGVTNTIVGVHVLTQTVAGTYSGSADDDGTENGIGMAINGNYLYASYSTSGSLATFAVQSGCALQFISDIFPSGLNGGTVKGMALYKNLMVVTYGDGSIESFNIANGVPVSNGDAQTSAGSGIDDFPDGVVITADGHYAIFGDDSSGAAVEVSDISSGELTQTVLYSLPAGANSNNVLLSPDETLLYVTNNTSGQVSAAFFNSSTGAIAGSCISPQLSGFDSNFSFLSGPVTQLSTGTGGMLYVPEFGSSIALINVSVSNSQCTLTEAAGSPVSEPNSASLISLAVVPIAQPGLYSPAPGSTLTSSNVTFQWVGDSSATAFWIDIGSSPGNNNYYSSGSLPTTTLSTTVAGLPTNGSTIYVTLYWNINDSWTPNAYTFTAFNPTAGAGAMTTPTPGSTLTGSTVTFDWTAGSTATAYWLDIGNAAGGNNYYSSGNLGNVLTRTVAGLPTNGGQVYVTLYSLVGGVWTPNPYTYTAFNLATAAGTLTTPTPGSILSSGTITFGWTAGTGTSAYWMDIGSSPGGNNLHSSGNLGNVLTVTISALPTDGSTIYVTLYSQVNGQWIPNQYMYTALNATANLATMTSPTPGTTLSGSTVSFMWTSDPNSTAYWVDIGSTAGGNNIYSSGNLGSATATTVTSLPANGTTIYITLYSSVGGQWLKTSSTYISGP